MEWSSQPHELLWQDSTTASCALRGAAVLAHGVTQPLACTHSHLQSVPASSAAAQALLPKCCSPGHPWAVSPAPGRHPTSASSSQARHICAQQVRSAAPTFASSSQAPHSIFLWMNTSSGTEPPGRTKRKRSGSCCRPRPRPAREAQGSTGDVPWCRAGQGAGREYIHPRLVHTQVRHGGTLCRYTLPMCPSRAGAQETSSDRAGRAGRTGVAPYRATLPLPIRGTHR